MQFLSVVDADLETLSPLIGHASRNWRTCLRFVAIV